MSYLNKENLYFEKYEKNVETVEKTEKLSEKGNSAKLDSELENLYQKLCRNLEDNSQLNDLFRRFFQTKTKLAFLLEENFFNDLVTKINNSSTLKQSQYNMPQRNIEIIETLPTSPSHLDYLLMNYSPTVNYPINFGNNMNNNRMFNEIPLMNSNVYHRKDDLYHYNNELRRSSPKKPNDKIPVKNINSSLKNANFYGDLSQNNFIYTKMDPQKKDLCKIIKLFKLKFYEFEKKKILP